MKTYKLVHLNKGIHLKRENDLKAAEEVINRKVAAGWTLQQIVSPADLDGVMVGVFYKEV